MHAEDGRREKQHRRPGGDNGFFEQSKYFEGLRLEKSALLINPSRVSAADWQTGSLWSN